MLANGPQNDCENHSIQGEVEADAVSGELQEIVNTIEELRSLINTNSKRIAK